MSPNAAFYVILIKKIIKLLLTRFFFSFKYLFLLAITNKKRGDHRSSFLAETTKGAIPAPNEHFARGDWGEF